MPPSPALAAIVDKPAPIAWPPRWGDDRPGLGKGVVLVVPRRADNQQARRYGEHHQGRPTPTDLTDLQRLAQGRTSPAGYRFRMEGPGGLVWVPEERPNARSHSTAALPESAQITLYPITQAPPPEAAERIGVINDDDGGCLAFVELDPKPVATTSKPRPTTVSLAFISGHVRDDAARYPGDRADAIEVERTWMDLHRPPTPARGVVIILPGLYGEPRGLFNTLSAALVDDGWAVLRLYSPPSRFMETHLLTLDPADPAASAAAAAAWFDQRFAEVAYAVEAGLAKAEQIDATLKNQPWAVLGMSGGAIAAPAVVTRLRDTGRAAPLAVVLAAGGENALQIAAQSEYAPTVDAVRFQWPGKPESADVPPDDILAPVADRFLQAAQLDPANLASRLTDTRVLVLHATRDRAVSAAAGEALWTRLGKPERWVAESGHLELFLRLWFSNGDLVRWLDQAAATADTDADRTTDTAGAAVPAGKDP